MEQWWLGLLTTLGMVVLVGGAYYAFSYLVLYLGGRLLPLAGRRRRRD